MENDPQGLLQRLQTEGRLDSSGRFTMDPLRAQALLRENLVADPDHFALCLVAGAVLRGASFIRILCDAQQFEMNFNGEPVSLAQACWLVGADLPEVAACPPRDLQFGLLAASSLGPRRVLLESAPAEGAGVRLTMTPKEVHCEATSRVSPGNRVHIDFPRTSLLGKARTSHLEVVQLLRQRCRWSGIDLRVNGKPVHQFFDSPHSLAARVIQGPRPDISTPLGLAESGRYSAILVVGGDPAPVEVVVGGVAFEYPGELEFPVSGLVYADHLRKDLSQAALVRDEEWRDFEDWFKGEARKLVGSLFRRWDQLSSEQRELAVPFLDKLAEVESRAGNLELAQKVYERLLAQRALHHEPTDPDVLLNLSNLATLHSLQNRHQDALEIFLAIAEDLLKAERYGEACTYYARALSLEARLGSGADLGLLAALVGWVECSMEEQKWSSATQLARAAYRRLEAVRQRVGPEQAQAVASRLRELLQPVRAAGPLGAIFEDELSGRICARCWSSHLLAEQEVEGLRVGGLALRASLCQTCGHVEWRALA